MPSEDNLRIIAANSRRQQAAQQQWPTREREAAARRRAAIAYEALHRDGFSCRQVAEQIGVPRRTLSHWHTRHQRGELEPCCLGRPCKKSPFADRYTALEVLEDLGPQLGMPTLRRLLPDMPPAELSDLRDNFRSQYRQKQRVLIEQLHWNSPGTVWAMDHYDPPQWIDGVYPSVLAVRDLASGMQLAWLPVADQTADVTALVLSTLLAEHGAPLVIKSDNGSAFKSHLLMQLLEQWHIVPLHSPPAMPQYNGSCEAGIGSLQSRTTLIAARHGPRP